VTPAITADPGSCSFCHAAASRAASGTVATRHPAPIRICAQAAVRPSQSLPSGTRSRASPGAFPRRAAASWLACESVSSPRTATI